jgi:hypothetical protein
MLLLSSKILLIADPQTHPHDASRPANGVAHPRVPTMLRPISFSFLFVVSMSRFVVQPHAPSRAEFL